MPRHHPLQHTHQFTDVYYISDLISQCCDLSVIPTISIRLFNIHHNKYNISLLANTLGFNWERRLYKGDVPAGCCKAQCCKARCCKAVCLYRFVSVSTLVESSLTTTTGASLLVNRCWPNHHCRFSHANSCRLSCTVAGQHNIADIMVVNVW